jgi:peptidoglycan/xylan/chitin deacetylase (PgdA/CDA1 family)
MTLAAVRRLKRPAWRAVLISAIGIGAVLGAGLYATPSSQTGDIRFVGKTKYLNNARAVVTHTIDDSTKHVLTIIDTMDKHGIKGTLFISTAQDPPVEERFFTQLQVWNLWPRLERAIEDGHEIGSHARTHPCRRPDTQEYCSEAYTEDEVVGSRDDILRRTRQTHVWSWCYPCGHCANHEFIQKRIADAGYIVARSYPDEPTNGHLVPDLRTWAPDFFNAAYTQVVQKRGGSATTEVIDVEVLNRKFDEVYAEGGIYHFLSHPQWLDFGPEGFYERHLTHIARRSDVWYVPMGPLYAYRTLADRTEVEALPTRGGVRAAYRVNTTLDTRIYNGSITLEFQAPLGATVRSSGGALAERPAGPTDRWTGEYLRRDGQRLYVTVKPGSTLEFW